MNLGLNAKTMSDMHCFSNVKSVNFNHFKSFMMKKIKKQISRIFLLGLMLFLITGCAHSMALDACIDNDLYGFWGGLWHGIISPFSFVLSLFKDDIALYAVNNTGGWYDFGFVLGAGILFGGGGKAS